MQTKTYRWETKSRVVRDTFPQGSHESSHKAHAVTSVAVTVLALIVGILCVVVFFHLDAKGEVSGAIQSWGAAGVLLSIFLMALFCVLPVPSEFLMIMNMKIYGVWWGIFYTWLGAMIGAVAVFLAARFFGGRLLRAFVSGERLSQFDQWVAAKGTLGLLAARLVPLPFIVVNYASGVLKSIRISDYVWTTAIGLLPYDIGAALVYLGVSQRLVTWLVLGGVALVAIWGFGYFVNRRLKGDRAGRVT